MPVSIKQRIGAWIIPRLPVSRHVFNHFRLELNALCVRMMHRFHPRYIVVIGELRRRRNILVNVGCGPFGQFGWVNLDLYPQPNLSLRSDSRRSLPLAGGSCIGIHVEHFLEHLDPADECLVFLRECRRCLDAEGVLRVIVPDAGLYIRAYSDPGWATMNRIGLGGANPQDVFACKMDVLNHIFIQEWEHYGGWDGERLELMLRNAGFTRVSLTSWREGCFPGGCIDREQHRSYSLYVEGKP